MGTPQTECKGSILLHVAYHALLDEMGQAKPVYLTICPNIQPQGLGFRHPMDKNNQYQLE